MARYEQKLSTPRSKHSATEQRRRSKINDRYLYTRCDNLDLCTYELVNFKPCTFCRFSMLRGLIPHGDQKRDKASFLLEVYLEKHP